MKQILSPRVLALLVIILLSSACDADVQTSTPEGTVPEQEIIEMETGAPVPTNTATPLIPTSTPVALATVVPTATATDVPAPEPTMTSSPAAVSEIALRVVATGFDRPTFLTHAGDERIFVVEKPGRIRLINEGLPAAEPFLDITDRVGSSSSEQGLLSMAFHPDFADIGKFYVNYTNLGGNTIVSVFQISTEDPNRADKESEEILLQVNQPFVNHNGGQIEFGPDGYLYIAMGDGGSQGDPQGNGQNPQSLLGAILRLDVDSGTPYAIPPDNPFVAIDGHAEEIWAIGLRNPWRLSFDRETGDLFVTDVGQSDFEEVNFQPALSSGGANYGWSITEGSQCYRSETCSHEGLEMPVGEYSHTGGRCTIIGGYVYRGQAYPDLRGNYFFGDYCSGTIWRLFRANSEWSQMPVIESGLFISSFGEDMNGEIYALDLASGTIYQVTSP
jgi:glucose/arabinose dehydrogenase